MASFPKSATRQLRRKKHARLQRMCMDRGLSTDGNKAAIMERLVHDACELYDLNGKTAEDLRALCEDHQLHIRGSASRVRSYLLGHLVMCGYSRKVKSQSTPGSAELYYVVTPEWGSDAGPSITKNKNRAYFLAELQNGCVMAFGDATEANSYAVVQLKYDAKDSLLPEDAGSRIASSCWTARGNNGSGRSRDSVDVSMSNSCSDNNDTNASFSVSRECADASEYSAIDRAVDSDYTTLSSEEQCELDYEYITSVTGSGESDCDDDGYDAWHSEEDYVPEVETSAGALPTGTKMVLRSSVRTDVTVSDTTNRGVQYEATP